MKSMEQVGIDPETGEFDVDVVETGQSKRQLDRRKQLGAVIEEKGGTTGRDLPTFLDMGRERYSGRSYSRVSDVRKVPHQC